MRLYRNDILTSSYPVHFAESGSVALDKRVEVVVAHELMNFITDLGTLYTDGDNNARIIIEKIKTNDVNAIII